MMSNVACCVYKETEIALDEGKRWQWKS